MPAVHQEAPEGLEFIEPDWPAPPSVRAGSTTRRGGVSHPPYDRLNLALRVGDDANAVVENRRRLETRLHLPAEPLWMRQVHGTRVIEAERADPDTVGDACIARSSGRPCAVLSADCLPILLCARHGGAVAAVHAGWRGLAAGVIESTVAAMRTPAREVLAWLGPGIGAAAYEVGPEVREAFMRRHREDADAFVPTRPGHWTADLARLARARLSRCGVAAVHGGNRCTHSDPRRFYSYRRDGTTGRFATLIWIEAPAPPPPGRRGAGLNRSGPP